MGQKLGQHFLKDKSALFKITAALAPQKGETVIEIGGGHGELTKELLALSDKLLASPPKIVTIEKDARLAEELRIKFAKARNLEIVEGDVREVLPSLISKLKAQSSKLPYKIVGNIPYYLTGFLLRLIGEREPSPQLTVLLIQKEVAERLLAKPPHMNKLAASVGFWGKGKIILQIPPGAFSPPPKVESAVIQIFPIVKQGKEKKYFATVQSLFSQPRKTVLNNLAATLQLPKEKLAKILKEKGIDPSVRPQTLSLSQIHSLTSFF
ncbi:MAG: ribosomal RNA small subunit methyltransferase A [Candidatus Liptonbacteria bacterium]|nr:ribosomal RNA small subunit methyltransferase A [Candidatus Liptonbacteria bacterium]